MEGQFQHYYTIGLETDSCQAQGVNHIRRKQQMANATAILLFFLRQRRNDQRFVVTRTLVQQLGTRQVVFQGMLSTKPFLLSH